MVRAWVPVLGHRSGLAPVAAAPLALAGEEEAVPVPE
jgi:hypothetical protein